MKVVYNLIRSVLVGAVLQLFFAFLFHLIRFNQYGHNFFCSDYIHQHCGVYGAIGNTIAFVFF